MQKIIHSFLTVIFCLGSLSAQTFIGNITPLQDVPAKINSTKNSLNILAVLVSFPEDKDEATFGNGKFGTIYSKEYADSILDPLPHDKAYFEAHLKFVQNYFRKVSGGKLNVSYTVLPNELVVSKTMRNYTSPNNSNDFTNLGNFAQEVWDLADKQFSAINFSDYDLFIIFHAGVGRDVSLPGSLGNEKDIPSVYLGYNSLKKIFGDSFNGFPVNNNSFNIKNTLIMPETESRELNVIGGNVLFEITINGLLVASVANHLGLPDLFNTKTGVSAIGRFGLMDGQSIFAFNGLFPPEPSAWEKIFLNWETPVEIAPGNYSINLVSKQIASISDTVILKVPINSTEYFLVENRNRDSEKNGAIVKYVVKNDTLTKTFFKDSTGFQSFDVSDIDGVVIDVDDFDWAVPGSGIAIWHIDQSIISSKISDNEINADKNNRGVDLEEADGIQDIGERFVSILGDEIIGEGTEQDLWFSSNPARLYNNVFNNNSRPDSKSNSGANSLITISDFSDISNKMSFKIAYADSIIQAISYKKLSISDSVKNITSIINSLGNQSIAVNAGSNLYLTDINGNILEIINDFTEFKPAYGKLQNAYYLVGALGNNLNFYFNNGITSSVIKKTLPFNVSSPVLLKPNQNGSTIDSYDVFVASDNGRFSNEFEIGSTISLPQNQIVKQVDTNLTVVKAAMNFPYFAFITNPKNSAAKSASQFFDSNGNEFSFNGFIPLDLALTVNKTGNEIAIVLTENNIFVIIEQGKIVKSFKPVNSTDINSFSLANLKSDGENYIIFNDGISLHAYNLSGAEALNFPFADPLNIGFIGKPLAADFEGDSNSEIISFTKDGRIFALDGGSGNIVSGFPVSIGNANLIGASLFDYTGKTSLAVLNSTNYLFTWNIGTIEGKYDWNEVFGNQLNSSFLSAAKATDIVSDFFPLNRVYNYPNPVYGNTTQIRYFVSENSVVNVKIFDLAGDFVAELNSSATGGMDNEISWNVSNIQSGVYLARVEATSSSGRTEQKIIKIMVVK